MNLIMHIKEAFLNLFNSKLQSFLAILGILVGAGSVVALISSSQLATAHALEQFKSLGTNLLAMNIESSPGAQKTKQERNFQLADAPKLKQSSSDIQIVAPYISLYQSIFYKGKSINGQTIGATQAFAEVGKLHLLSGRFVSYLDHDSYYCVIGSGLARQLAKSGNLHPIGSRIQLGEKLFTIIGTLKPWPQNLFIYADINNSIIIPLKTSYLVSNYAQIQSVLFRVTPGAKLSRIQDHLTTVLKRLLPHKQAEFRNPEQIIAIMGKQRQTFSLLLAAIGGISLIVGGIGVMNIMLVSVIERRQEIGIRMAIGARRRDIRRMFLIESIVLTMFGGALGVILGMLIAFFLAYFSHWGYHLYLLPPSLGFVVSVLVGIISGYYPAYRASNLDPIQTLQGE